MQLWDEGFMPIFITLPQVLLTYTGILLGKAPQNPSTTAFLSLHRWGWKIVIQNVSQKVNFLKRHRNRRSIWKEIQSGRMETVSSKSCDQEQLFTKCQHLKKVLTVAVSSGESNTCWDKGAREGERNTTECKWLAGKQLPVVSLKIFQVDISEH